MVQEKVLLDRDILHVSIVAWFLFIQVPSGKCRDGG
jgi:hypothetical protein